MIIFLGLTLLAVSLAAPVDVKDLAGLDGERLVQLEDTEDIIGSLIKRDVPYSAITDYFVLALNIGRADRKITQEYFDRITMWGKKWNIAMVEDVEYDPVEQRIIYHENRTHSSTTTEKSSNDIDDDTEQWPIRTMLRRIGVQEEAVDEFFTEKLHTAPFDIEKNSRMIEWGKKWEVEKVRVDGFIDRLVKIFNKREEERQRKQEASASETTTVAAEEPVEPIAAPQFEDDAKKIMNKMNKEDIAQIIHEMTGIFAHTSEYARISRELFVDGVLVPEKVEMANDFFNNLPEYEKLLLNRVQSDSEWKAAEKFGNGTREAIKETVRLLTQVFAHTEEWTNILQTVFVDGELVPEKVEMANTFFNNLPEYERELINNVYADLERKVTKQFGTEDKHANKDNIPY